MKHAEIGVNGAYHTSDLYVAAWLLTKGLELQDIDRRNSRRCDFIFNLRRARRLVEKDTMCPLQSFVKPYRLAVAIIRRRQGGYLKRAG